MVTESTGFIEMDCRTTESVKVTVNKPIFILAILYLIF